MPSSPKPAPSCLPEDPEPGCVGKTPDEFPNHDLEGLGRVHRRVPSSCGSSTRRCHSNFQRTGLDGSNEAHRGTRARLGHHQPSLGRPGPRWLANHGRRPSASSFDRGVNVNLSRADEDHRDDILAAGAIGSAGRDQPAAISPSASIRKKSGAARSLRKSRRTVSEPTTA
jgi:hypothetical protein